MSRRYNRYCTDPVSSSCWATFTLLIPSRASSNIWMGSNLLDLVSQHRTVPSMDPRGGEINPAYTQTTKKKKLSTHVLSLHCVKTHQTRWQLPPRWTGHSWLSVSGKERTNKTKSMKTQEKLKRCRFSSGHDKSYKRQNWPQRDLWVCVWPGLWRHPTGLLSYQSCRNKAGCCHRNC